MRKLVMAAVAAGSLCLAAPGQADAQVRLGPQVSIGDADVGIGGRVLVNMSDLEGWEGSASVDVFPDADLWEVNGNLHYNFAIDGAPDLFPYVGPGLNIGYLDEPVDDTELGVNFVGGTKFRAAERFTPYAELRLIAGGHQELVVTGGILF